jgi:hypothetical protein
MVAMRRALWLVMAACGGQAGATAATPEQPSASSSTAPSASSAEDTSPPSMGTRHKKIGNGWFLSGGGKEFYDAIYEPGADPRVVVKQQSDPHGRWVTLMKNVSSAPYAGKKIRVRIAVKSAGVTGRGEVWARAAARHAAEDAPNITTPLDPTAEMKTYDVTIDVPDNARVVEYGVSLAGDGEVWVGKDAIDLVP